MYAIAFDLGTTTLAGSLLDLTTGKRLASAGSMNPQRSFGADVVSRLQSAVESEASLIAMSHLIRDELWRLIEELCAEGGISTASLRQIALAGNPAMQHILLQLPVKTLAFPPYRPDHSDATELSAVELGWNCPADLYLFPMPGGFVGGDTVAFLYGELNNDASSPENRPPTLYLDMGTNGEIALVTGPVIWATSAAAGPAFEGGNLSCGMVALPGAINSVLLNDEKLKITTIANRPPIGICGSAALQAIDQFLQHGIIESTGRMRESGEIASNLGGRVIRQGDQQAFVLHRDASKLLSLTQGDIRQVQLAKSALRAGIEVLAERAGITLANLAETVLTGSFGAFLEPAWLKSIGIFDKVMVQTTRFTPEGALAGVEKALRANDNFAAVAATGKRFKVVPLSGTPMFENLFINNINFPSNT